MYPLVSARRTLLRTRIRLAYMYVSGVNAALSRSEILHDIRHIYTLQNYTSSGNKV